jgi:hypothetical protein
MANDRTCIETSRDSLRANGDEYLDRALSCVVAQVLEGQQFANLYQPLN